MDFYGRRSIRKYQERKIEDEKIKEILRTALISPTGRNKKPFELIVIDNEEILAKVSDAKAMGAAMLKGAPLAIAVVGNTEESTTWVEDCSIVSTYIMLKAYELGIGSCWVQMKGRSNKEGRSTDEILEEIFSLPEGKEVLSVMALGYPDEDKPSHGEGDMDFSKVKLNSYKTNYFDR